MTIVLAFIQRYWVHLLLAAVLVAGLMYVGNLRLTIATQQTEIAQLKGEIKTLETANEVLTASNVKLADALERQTAKVNEWLDQAAQRKAASDAALAKAKRDAELWKKKYGALLSAPPAVPGDDCASLNVLLNQYITLRRGELR
jgi:regulator of replication initiation timing